MTDATDSTPERAQRSHVGGVRRRRFVQTLLAGGLCVQTVQAHDDGNRPPTERGDRPAAEGGEVTIVYGYARRDPTDPQSLEPRTKSVPAAWYDRVERAFSFRTRLANWGLGGILGAFVIPGSYDEYTAGLSVHAASEDAKSRLFDLLSSLAFDGIDFEVDVLNDLPPRDHEPLHPIYTADPSEHLVAGGVFCAGDRFAGTLAPAMYRSNAGHGAVEVPPFFATANHLYGAAGTKRTEHVGHALDLDGPAGRHRIGEVVAGYPHVDTVRVQPVDGYAPKSELVGVSPSTVVGQFTRWGLADLQARGEPLAKVGAISGYTTGPIKGVDGVTCFVGETCKTGQLKWGDESSMDDGDSGSVTFHPDPEHPDDHLMICGFNDARTWWPGANYTWGTAAYELHDRFGFHF